MPTRRRRCQPRSRNTLLDYPQLFRRRPSKEATRVNNFKATDVASVSKVIHNDNQLHTGQFGKAAYTGWIPFSVVGWVRKGRRYGRKLVDRGADRAWGAARRRNCDGGDVLPHSIRDEAGPLYVRFRAPGTPERGRLTIDAAFATFAIERPDALFISSG